jgi:hypothetical protein
MDYRQQMTQAKTVTARKKRTAAQAPDPRFAALARLLARHAARQDFEKTLSQRELIETQDGGYDSDSPAGDDPS